jgi:hypothetical protein
LEGAASGRERAHPQATTATGAAPRNAVQGHAGSNGSGAFSKPTHVRDHGIAQESVALAILNEGGILVQLNE